MMTDLVPRGQQSEPPTNLAQYLDDTTARQPSARALVDTDGSALSYEELSAAADRVAFFLHRNGIVAGDRVGLCMRKSAQTLAAIFGILRLGAAYVPTDAGSSGTRAATLFDDCNVRIIFTDPESARHLIQHAPQLKPRVVVIKPRHKETNDTYESWQT
ncbi:AMP-binding protein, partial [Mycetohabitans sp. B5]